LSSDWIVVAQHHEHNDVDYNFMINVANKVQQEFETALRAATNPRDVLDPVKVGFTTLMSCYFMYYYIMQESYQV
jgi:hypothetical protein